MEKCDKLISAQNIDCGYSLGPHHGGGCTGTNDPCFRIEMRKIMVTPCQPKFYYMKMGFGT